VIDLNSSDGFASKPGQTSATTGVDTADSGVNVPTTAKLTSPTVNSGGKPVVSSLGSEMNDLANVTPAGMPTETETSLVKPSAATINPSVSGISNPTVKAAPTGTEATPSDALPPIVNPGTNSKYDTPQSVKVSSVIDASKPTSVIDGTPSVAAVVATPSANDVAATAANVTDSNYSGFESPTGGMPPPTLGFSTDANPPSVAASAHVDTAVPKTFHTGNDPATPTSTTHQSTSPSITDEVTAVDSLPQVAKAFDATNIGAERPTIAKPLGLLDRPTTAVVNTSSTTVSNREAVAIETGLESVTPKGLDPAPPTREHAGSANFGGGPRVPPTPTPTLGVPGAPAITRIGTGSSAALGNTDTRANTDNKSDIESTSVSSKSPPTENSDATLHGPEDPHTSNQPICSVNDELSGEALRHAFNVGTIKGKVPYGMDEYDPKIHGDDMDLYRSASALGYCYQDYPEPTTPKHFMDALQVGYISARHKAMGGPVMYLKAICASFCPRLPRCSSNSMPKANFAQVAGGPRLSPLKNIANRWSWKSSPSQ